MAVGDPVPGRNVPLFLLFQETQLGLTIASVDPSRERKQNAKSAHRNRSRETLVAALGVNSCTVVSWSRTTYG
jgi:hypothetical protein